MSTPSRPFLWSSLPSWLWNTFQTSSATNLVLSMLSGRAHSASLSMCLCAPDVKNTNIQRALFWGTVPGISITLMLILQLVWPENSHPGTLNRQLMFSRSGMNNRKSQAYLPNYGPKQTNRLPKANPQPTGGNGLITPLLRSAVALQFPLIPRCHLTKHCTQIKIKGQLGSRVYPN